MAAATRVDIVARLMPVRGLLVLATLCLSACFTDAAPDLTGGGGGGGSSGSSGGSTSMEDPTGGGVCGDGVVQPGEQCDIGPMGNGACTDKCRLNVCGDGYVGAGESCDGTPGCVDCKSADCGNGVVDAGEACDDGNKEPGDACTDLCKPAACGDGVVQVGVEECDDGNQIDEDACLNACLNAACGDGIVGPGELCDDGNQVDDDGCTNVCALPVCGDGIVTPDEECDDGNQIDGDACLSSCKNATCGDAIVWAGTEECDDGNVDDLDACLTGCKANVCGDGILDMTEEACDHGPLNSDDAAKAACTTTCTRTAFAVFVTQELQTPGVTFSGVAAADQLCTDLAAGGSLGFKGSRWKAWLVTTMGGPSTTFFQSPMPYVKYTATGVTAIAQSWADLTDGSLLSPINYTEARVALPTGNTCTSATAVWTGEAGKGSCTDWTTNGIDLKAGIGNYSSISGQWQVANCQLAYSCNKGARLYCFEQPTM